jgi:hypothetical protein
VLDALGSSVAIKGDTIVAGAPLAEPPPISTLRTGEVCVFERTFTGPGGAAVWTERQRIALPAPLVTDDRFGTGVAYDGVTLLAGANARAGGGAAGNIRSGAGFAYTRTPAGAASGPFSLAGSILPADGAVNDGAVVVAVDGTGVAGATPRAVLGGPGHDLAGLAGSAGANAGAIWTYALAGAPTDLAGPADVTVNIGATATLGVAIRGAAPAPGAGYSWTHNGRPVVDGPGGASLGGGTVSGAGGPTLVITGATTGDAGTYSVSVVPPCGGTTAAPLTPLVSPTARLTVRCPADFDAQNGVDLLDIFSFLTAWFAGCP